MKNIFFYALCLAAFPALAQNGFYIQPEAGMGASGIQSKEPPVVIYLLPNFELGSLQTITSYSGRILGGYRFGKWEVSTGLVFLETGYIQNYSGGEFVLINYQQEEIYKHIGIPATVNYRFAFGKHVFVTPGLGVMYSDNLPSEIRTTESLGTTSNVSITKLTQD